jgi:hypothetical protein
MRRSSGRGDGLQRSEEGQALGDARALRDGRRRLIAFEVGHEPVAAIERLANL